MLPPRHVDLAALARSRELIVTSWLHQIDSVRRRCDPRAENVHEVLRLLADIVDSAAASALACRGLEQAIRHTKVDEPPCA